MTLRFSFLAALLLLAPFSVEAAPVSVILYPSGAHVTEEAFLSPENGRLLLQIPAGADEGSLEFFLSRGTVTGSSVRLREGVSAPEMKAVHDRLDALEKDMALAQARRESLSQQRRFWSTPPTSDNAQMQDRQADILAARLEILAVEDAELSSVLRDLSFRKQALEKRLDALGRQNEQIWECILEVADTDSDPVHVRWSYMLNDAGWQPRYRIQAMQKDGRVRIAMDAVIHQSSGSNWEHVDTLLSSSEDFRSAVPPSLPDWIIGGGRSTLVAKSMNLTAARAPSMDKAAGTSAMSHASGLRWSLGKVTVPAGVQVSRPVDAYDFDAVFCRLLRPAEDERAWIMATVPDEQVLPLLPAGQASFIVDGVENARSLFGIAPGDHDLFFGIDQLVGAKVHAMPARSTEGPAGTHTSQWRWNMDITNGHDTSVTVRVEAAAPVLRDPRMVAKNKSRPAADFHEDRSCYEWNLELPARKTISVVHEVTVTAPVDTTSERP